MHLLAVRPSGPELPQQVAQTLLPHDGEQHLPHRPFGVVQCRFQQSLEQAVLTGGLLDIGQDAFLDPPLGPGADLVDGMDEVVH